MSQDPSASQAQVEQAEALIRQANIAKIRGEKQKAARLLQEAAQTAPTSPAVLEIVGDSAMENRDYKGARDAYQMALLASPGNVGLERKHAEAILALQTATDPFLVGGNDVATFAQGRSAVIISIFLPGVGHMLASKVVLGSVFLALHILGVVAAVTLGGFQTFVSLFASSSQASTLGGLSIAFLVVNYLACQFHMASLAKQMEVPRIERPKPPVDKPF